LVQLSKQGAFREAALRILTSSLVALLITASTQASELKCSQIKLVVPYTAGGATDVAARLVARHIEPLLKTSTIIETRTGATGNIGSAFVATSPADGCTLLVNGAVIATYPHSFKSLSYDPIKDLTAIGSIGVTPTVLVTSNKSVNNLQDLLAWSKTKPEGLSYGSAGYGLLHHLAVEEIAEQTKAKLVHVPYRGGGSATQDLVTGELAFGSFALGSVVSFIKNGDLKIVSVLQSSRTTLAPDAQTIAEQGFPKMNAGVHFMVFAPSKTSKEIVNQLSAALAKVVGDSSLKPNFDAIGFDPLPMDANSSNELVRQTGTDWAPVIQRLKIQL
jgi:tripartite-type tricarboxylate transporter receptor subunit TctC